MSEEEGITVAKRLTAWLLRKTTTNAIRRVSDLPMAMATELGLVRSENEDRVAVVRGRHPSGRSYVIAALCDGMGGMADGAVCAAMALGSFFSEFFNLVHGGAPTEDVLAACAIEANRVVHAKYRGSGGATLSAVLIDHDKTVYWLNVGDSRIYLYDDRLLTQLTTDDTIAGQLLNRNLSYEGSADLLQYVGVGPEIEPHISKVVAPSDARLLLTSDGVHYLQPDIMAKIAFNAPDLAVCIRRLVELSKWCGGHDNASAIMISPFSHDDSGSTESDTLVYEVWDPFGELQLVLKAPALVDRPDTTAARPISTNDNESSGEDVNGKKTHSAQSGADYAIKRKKSPKKTKSAKSDINHEVDRGNDLKGEVPQLKIEFPNKG